MHSIPYVMIFWGKMKVDDCSFDESQVLLMMFAKSNVVT